MLSYMISFSYFIIILHIEYRIIDKKICHGEISHRNLIEEIDVIRDFGLR